MEEVTSTQEGGNKTPIVFIHKGKIPYYFTLVMRQAHQSNPDSEIVLVTDKNTRVDRFIKKIKLDGYNKQSETLSSLYQHMSSNTYEFELFCIQRWFVLLELMEKYHMNQVVVCDSDYMQYTNVNKIIKMMNKKSLICVPNQQYELSFTASAHFSIWHHFHLKRFTLFVKEIYVNNINVIKKKWVWHQKNNMPGGVCDMSLLYLFYQQNPTFFLNGLVVKAESCVDQSIKDSNIYQYNNKEYFIKKINRNGRYKDVKWQSKRPYVRIQKSNEKIWLHGLHCQGDAKYLIYYFFQSQSFNIIELKKHIFFLLGWLKTELNRLRKTLPFQFSIKKIMGIIK